jgi:hypothetical protein
MRPLFYHATASGPASTCIGDIMIFDTDMLQMTRELNLLQQAAARTGFSVSDIEALVECELDTNHVLDYISAVTLRRMN